jgi:putative endopeptidase
MTIHGIYRNIGLSLLVIGLGAACTSAKKEPLAANAESKPQATSEIPARREFPVNPKIDPCKDFYAYSCSEVQSHFKLRPDRSRHTFAFDDSAERILEAKKKFFLGLDQEKNLSKRGKELQNVYLACMNEPASKQEELDWNAHVVKELEQLKTKADFQKYVASKVLTGESSFVEFGTLPDLDDPNRYSTYMLGTLQDLPERSYYDNPPLMKEYEEVSADALRSLGQTDVEARAHATVALEKAFAQTYPLPAEFRVLMVTRSSISKEDLLKRFPHLGLEKLLDYIPKNTVIRDLSSKNLEFLDQALDKTDLQTLKDAYLLREVVMDDAYPTHFKKRFDFDHKYLGGPAERSERQERCTRKLMASFGKEVDSILMPRLFPHFPEKDLIALAQKVKNSIVEEIEHNTWLSPQAKKAAQEKMQVARLQLIAPRNDREWDFAPPAHYTRNMQYANFRLLARNLKFKELDLMKKPRDRTIWGMSPLTINAYYSPPDNKFVLPIGILQYPFYDANMPVASQFGAVGSVIGHELGHGIDDKGALYDSKGRLQGWFTPEDTAEFKRRGQNLGKQFAAAGENPELTMGENIGDLVGVTSAYRTAFPNGEGTPQQKREFFSGWGRVWCTVRGPGVKELQLKTDPHSLAEERVNQQVRQQKAFAEAFACQKGDPMTLSDTDRVVIW